MCKLLGNDKFRSRILNHETMEDKMKRLSIFDPFNSNVENRVIEDLEQMKQFIGAIRLTSGEGKIVLTQGSFDNAHVGHYRYLEKAREAGAFLVVGIDSDEKIRKRKGEHRPVVDQDERAEILCHTRYADLVIIKEMNWEKWALIDAIRPDILIATQETYTEDQIKDLKDRFGCEVVVLPPQAESSTTAKIRKLMIGGAQKLSDYVATELPGLLQRGLEKVLDGTNKPEKGDEK